MNHFEEVVSSHDKISIGGMIFVVSLSFGAALTGEQVNPGCSSLDMKAFQTIG